jgi:FimV-like protein
MRTLFCLISLSWSMLTLADTPTNIIEEVSGMSEVSQTAVLKAEVRDLQQENQSLQAILNDQMVPSLKVPDWFAMHLPTDDDSRTLLLMLILLCGIFLWWHGLSLAETVLVQHDEEYNFLETDAAIPAKLDLAQAYVVMGDYGSATLVLREVLDAGNDAQRSQAERMMRQMVQ